MTLQGYQFDKAKVTPEADAQLYSYLAQSSDNKVISGMTVTATGLNVYVASGKALVQGRLIENTQQVQLTAQANKTGYICITIDLTQDNTSTGTPGTSDYVPVNNQLRLELVEVLNQQDLNNGGLIYTFPLYSYVSTGATVTLTKIVASHMKKGVIWTGKFDANANSDSKALKLGDLTGVKYLHIDLLCYNKFLRITLDISNSYSNYNLKWKYVSQQLIPEMEVLSGGAYRVWEVEILSTGAISNSELRFGMLRFMSGGSSAWNSSDSNNMSNTFVTSIAVEY
ncbi:hypothetical protein [Pseudolactococcus raffinolactis]|uniref:hypothetical protein n=1 Tax=Pseudolactococcus raffinolactis TaxID=1366 RepID=UPI00077BF143|nr:hypothetical protein [Lactococcus raffinolactis]PCS11365.1 hypothetical protein RU88_GL000239 [Lactococcus raffinolactis]